MLLVSKYIVFFKKEPKFCLLGSQSICLEMVCTKEEKGNYVYFIQFATSEGVIIVVNNNSWKMNMYKTLVLMV